MKFNPMPVPTTIVRRAAEDAAFAACRMFGQAQRELAMPSRRRSVLTVHAEVLRAQAVAESLARRTA